MIPDDMLGRCDWVGEDGAVEKEVGMFENIDGVVRTSGDDGRKFNKKSFGCLAGLAVGLDGWCCFESSLCSSTSEITDVISVTKLVKKVV